MHNKIYIMKVSLDDFRTFKNYRQLGDGTRTLQEELFDRLIKNLDERDRWLFFDRPFYIQATKVPYSEYRLWEECERTGMSYNLAKDLCPFDVKIEIKEMEKYTPIIQIPDLISQPVRVEYVEKPTLWQRIKNKFKRRK